MENTKELIEKSFEMGYEAFPKLDSAPYLNVEFMKFLPKCDFGDDRGCKLRIYLYKSYIKGWSKAHLDKVQREINKKK